MEVSRIEFQFKGARNYIHGTDIFTSMIAAYPLSVISNIRFSMHDFVHTPVCRLYRADTKEELSDVVVIRARCQFDAHGATHWLVLTQGSGDVTSGGRYEYDEERITSLCQMEEERIVLAKRSPFTFIENIVAMNKLMHQKLFPGVIGQWAFTRLDCTTGCDEHEKLALQFKHNMNLRLTRTDILVNEKKVGDLYFSLKKA